MWAHKRAANEMQQYGHEFTHNAPLERHRDHSYIVIWFTSTTAQLPRTHFIYMAEKVLLSSTKLHPLHPSKSEGRAEKLKPQIILGKLPIRSRTTRSHEEEVVVEFNKAHRQSLRTPRIRKDP